MRGTTGIRPALAALGCLCVFSAAPRPLCAEESTIDARVDLLRDMLDKENEGWER